MGDLVTKHPGFLIDLDGLLINSETLSMVAFEKLCLGLGCDFTQDYQKSIRGKKKSQWSTELVAHFALDESAEKIADLHTRLLLEEMNRSVSLLPGAGDLLAWIARKSHPAALVTSSDRNYAQTYLRRLGIEEAFQELVTAEDVERGKPDAEPYIMGANRIGRRPQDCIVLEDSVNGVLSGKAAGATVIGVPSVGLDNESLSASDFIVPSLVEALEVLKEMGL